MEGGKKEMEDNGMVAEKKTRCKYSSIIQKMARHFYYIQYLFTRTIKVARALFVASRTNFGR